MFEIINQGKSIELRLKEEFFTSIGVIVQTTPLIKKNSFIEQGDRLLSVETGRFLKTLTAPFQGIIKNYDETLFNYPEKWTTKTPIFLCQVMSKEEWEVIKAEKTKKSPPATRNNFLDAPSIYDIVLNQLRNDAPVESPLDIQENYHNFLLRIPAPPSRIFLNNDVATAPNRNNR